MFIVLHMQAIIAVWNPLGIFSSTEFYKIWRQVNDSRSIMLKGGAESQWGSDQ